jgi:hypothetical protein
VALERAFDTVLGGKWIDPAIAPRMALVPIIVDLTLCSEARRTLHGVLSRRGLKFFLKPNRGINRLDSRRIAWVVEAARRSAATAVRDPDALARTRRVVRRELLRHLAAAMVEAGL